MSIETLFVISIAVAGLIGFFAGMKVQANIEKEATKIADEIFDKTIAIVKKSMKRSISEAANKRRLIKPPNDND